MFKIDLSKASTGFTKLEEGTYEFVVEDFKVDFTQNGKEVLVMDLIVRSDVQQPHGGAKFTQNFWKRRDTNDFNYEYLMMLAKVFGLQDGKEYTDINGFLHDFIGRGAKGRVQDRTYTNSLGEEKKTQEIVFWEPTDFPQVNHVVRRPQQQGGAVPNFGRTQQQQPPQQQAYADNKLPF